MICEALVSTFIQCKKNAIISLLHLCIDAKRHFEYFSTSCFNKAHLLNTYFPCL